MQVSSPFSFLRIPIVLLTLVIVLLTGVLLVAYIYVALDWYGTPFIGFLPHRDLSVSASESLIQEEWRARSGGVRAEDQILTLDGENLEMLPAATRLDVFDAILNRHQKGDWVILGLLRDTSAVDTTSDQTTAAACMDSDTVGLSQCSTRVQLGTMPLGDFIIYFGVGWVTGVVLWLLALWLFWRQSDDGLVNVIVIISAALAVFLAGRFDTISTHQLSELWLLTNCLIGGLLVMFALEFPYRFASIQRNWALGWAPIIVSLALGMASIVLYRTDNVDFNRGAFLLALGVQVLGGVLLLLIMIWRRARSASPTVRNQSTMVIIGLVPALLLTMVWFGALFLNGHHPFTLLPINQSLPILLPLSMMYAVLRFRVIDTDRMITQSVLYGALLVMLLLSYWLLVSAITLVVGESMRNTTLHPMLIVVFIFAISVLFTPLRVFLQNQIDAIYFRARRRYQYHQEQFSRDATNAVGLNDLGKIIYDQLAETLMPTHTILFVRDIVSHEYRPLVAPETGEYPTDLVFSSNSGLVRYLNDHTSLLYLEEGRPLPLNVTSDRAKLAVLGAPIIAGLRGQRMLNGFLVIGPRQSGAPYLHEDLRFVESISDQAALSVERAQAVDDLERRVRVQDVLSQVSRALNFAIDFDTLLELIYAQTLRVIDAPCFYIALYNANIDELSYVFYNQGDDRVEAMENKSWRLGHDMMSEITRTQQTIRTDDFLRESLARDPHTRPDNPDLKAWMGVPLLADTGGVLGVMVAATTEPDVSFADEQQDLFWDIANLASSAIGKLHLFEKTQQRARQLAAINEISSQLSAEIENVDRLLNLITESAVQILDAEAGSLLLSTGDAGDLEFHVVVGGGGADLVGTRIPAGEGLAGATVQRGEPIIVNNPYRDARWYGDMRSTKETEALSLPQDATIAFDDDADQDTFQSGAILSVPLMVSGQAIGVLQTLNKRDGGIFLPEDADLLETFAGQAAIAIENARLFDMTDQQLALRVQELDTMQRIDQELNRTLRFDNVVDITMDWALRKSGATASALFMRDRERNELHLVSIYGYPPGLFPDNLSERIYPDDWGVIGRVIRTTQPSLITDVTIDPDYEELLPDCVAQLVVPLFSANQVIGIIMLESDRAGTLNLLDLDFVARLAEHASPAIANSQLFQEIERANEAKSEFVSFVAHELRNPMTSMKGYTDLLIKGVVGPVNEQQSDFLNTIYNNVARMEKLVSDLNDLTKQQTNNLRLEIFSVDFRNIVLETLRTQQQQIEDKHQTLNLEITEDLPLVRGDKNRLIQIMTNFISNAYKYTPAGGIVTIYADATRNIWDPQGAPEVVHCYVQDTGIGLSEEDLSQLFTPYFRSENPKTREQSGTGLGLTITKGLIEQHGGMIWVESELEVGTSFHFTIPVAAEDEKEEVHTSETV